MNRTRAVNIGLIIMLLFVGVVAASTIPVQDDLPLQTNSGFTVVLDDPGEYPQTNPWSDNDTISIASGTVTAPGSGTLTIGQSGVLSGGSTVLTSIDVTSTTVEVDPDDKPQVDLT
ncbi:MAG: hypothetical protein RI560_13880, partial [Natronomonas sp.]|nr:hypothetical protein [Natronomonas sp.]